MSGIVLATVVAYMGGLLAIGWWARRRSADSSGYFIGERRLGGWVAALSYAAGSSSAWSILGVSGIAFSQGLSAVWLLPGTLTGHLVVWFYMAPRLNRLAHAERLVTVSDVIALDCAPRDRRRVMLLSAGIIVFSFLFYVAAQFQGAATTFAATFDLAPATSLAIGALIVIAYTLTGGFWAVSLTDALQALLMFACAAVLPVWVVFQLGGPDAFIAAVSGQLTPAQTDLAGGAVGMTAIGFLIGMVSIGFGPPGQPHLQNRIMALTDRAALNRARLVALTWFVVVLGGMFVLGLAGHAIAAQPGDPERVFFVVAEHLLPAALTGVLLAAVLSAIMSTADSQLLVAASALTVDQGTHSLPLARLVVAGLGVSAAFLALLLPDSVFSRVLFAWNALGAAFGPTLLCRLFGWRLRVAGVLASVATGFGLTVVFYSLPNTPGDVAERAVPFVVAFAILLTTRARRAARMPSSSVGSALRDADQ